MRTKDIIESLLYSCKNPYFERNLRLAHITNNTDRNWKPVEHKEYYFTDMFNDANFVIVINKQIHVYIIGDITKNRTRIVLNVEGNTTNVWNLNKKELVDKIADTINEAKDEFLPLGIVQRIIFLGSNDNNCVFNRYAINDNLLRKSKWTIGVDMYNASNPQYDTNARQILQACLKEVDLEDD